MPFEIKFRDGLLLVDLHGKIRRADFVQLALALEEWEARLPVTPDRITDTTAADASELLSRDLVEIAERRHHSRFKNRFKSAIIAPHPELHGLARMFLGFNQNPDIELMIFKDAASAYHWLGRVGKPDAAASE